MKKKYDTTAKILIGIAGFIGLYVFVIVFFGFPIPRGSKVDDRYFTYYQNFRGIYFISVENSLALINHGSWGYLEDVDKSTFEVLAEDWAKDANHVWHFDDIVRTADLKSFHINESGLPVDKRHVFVRSNNGVFVPSASGIDPETAEYFVYRLGTLQEEWLRDKSNIYFGDKKIDVDRNSFSSLTADYFIDKDFIYSTVYNSYSQKIDLVTIDSVQSPIDTICQGSRYIRNGRNIIYGNTVILKDIDVDRIEEVGHLKCVINDMLYENGEQIMKGLLDVPNAKFYFYGRIAADGQSVFFDDKRLEDVDAATFRQIDNSTYEDRDYIYTIPEITYGKVDFSFDKKKK